MPEDHVESSITIEESNNCSDISVSEHNETEALETSPQELICDEVSGNPRQPVREALVATAAKFLQTSKVADSDTFTKQLFLSKKGLTQLELKEAFTRAGLSYEEAVNIENASAPPTTVPPWQLPPSTLHYSRPGAMQVAYPPWGRATLLWQRLKEFCHLVLFVTGAAYGAHYLYQHVIRPWLTGRRPPEPVELQVARMQAAVADSLVQLRSSVAALQLAVQGYTAAASKGCPSCGSDSTSSSSSPSLGQQLQQVKAELTSLKSLMLNRRNFTPTPSLAPSIPAWQRSNGNKDGEVVTSSTSATVTSIGSATVTSISSATVTTISSANKTSSSDSSVVACSSEGPVTSDAWTSAPSGSKPPVYNRVEEKNSIGGLMSATECAKDFVSSPCESAVTSSNSLGISYSSANTLPPHDNKSRVSNTADVTISSLSITSDAIVSIPDRPDRTSSADSIVYSDALDGSVVKGVAGNEDDLTNQQ